MGCVTAIGFCVLIGWMCLFLGGVGAAYIVGAAFPWLLLLVFAKRGQDNMNAPVWWVVVTAVLGMTGSVLAIFWGVLSEDAFMYSSFICGGYALVSFAWLKMREKTAVQDTLPQEDDETDSESVCAEDDAAPHSPRPAVRREAPAAKSPFEQLRENVTVDKTVFEKYGLVFKCNLVSCDGEPRLNFEVMRSKTPAAPFPKGEDLWIHANVYDADGNLLCLEYTWIEPKSIRHGYAADCIDFYDENMRSAASIWVYALDPAVEDEDEEDDWVN